jgi:hypothetical protein
METREGVAWLEEFAWLEPHEDTGADAVEVLAHGQVPAQRLPPRDVPIPDPLWLHRSKNVALFLVLSLPLLGFATAFIYWVYLALT